MNSRLQTNVSAMMALAHQRTEHSRIELANMLANVFLEDGADLTMREEELINELIDRLMSAQTPDLRLQIAQKFSGSTRMPRKLALSLANDSIELARDVLINSATLQDADLIEIVTTQSVGHAQAVACRHSIAEAVVDALVTTGDLDVMRLVAQNLGAKLSSKAVDILTEAARYAAELRAPVLQRPELTSECAIRLYWWLSQDLRRIALKRFGITSGQINEALAKTIEEFLGYHQLEKNNDEVMLQVADWLAEREVVSTAILPQILRLGHFRLFNILLSRLAGIALSLVDTIVAEIGGRGLAVVCRAIGIDKAGFVSIFLLSRGARADEQIVHPRELSEALMAFDRLTVKASQDMLHSWKLNPDYLTTRH